MTAIEDFGLNCPLPAAEGDRVLLGHGSGGKLMHDLLARVFLPAFDNEVLRRGEDGAVFEASGARLAFSTDAYVVKPLFFPGGDIGCMAVYGTLNDLAMCGARAVSLSASFILEEGFLTADLERIVRSMAEAARHAPVPVMTGDTKVVEKGKADGLYITTSGVGVMLPGLNPSPSAVKEGDAVLLSGDLGRHGIAIMSARRNLAFETPVQSDTALLSRCVQSFSDAGLRVHCMRDLTRGGLATAMVEIARTAHLRVELEEAAIPVLEEVGGACEILGLDPLYVANEGRMAVFVDPRDADAALSVMKQSFPGLQPARIGRVSGPSSPGRVTAKNTLGTTRGIDMLAGDPLPRIC